MEVHSEYLVHDTTEGERWDQIADRYYGDPYGYPRIIAANPDVAISPTLAGGQRLLIPVITEAPRTDVAALPPWKR